MPDDSSPLLAPHGVAALPDKRQVAASFSRAAASYDAVAELQRGVGESLLSALPEGFSPRRWVDLGCGTGYFSRALERRFGAAEGLAVDIAEGMLRHARARGGASHFIGGDAERLPLRDGSCDLLFSSLAIQWCADLPAVLAEARRVLTHELKALGAHNLNPGRPDGLTGRQRIRALVAAYERFRQPEGLPATYRVVFGVLRKDS